MDRVKLYRYVPRQNGVSAYIAEIEAVKMAWGYHLDPDHKVFGEMVSVVWDNLDHVNSSQLNLLRISESPVDAAYMALTHWQAEAKRLKEAWRDAEGNATDVACLGLAAAHDVGEMG
jgi:hypothetical protein